MATIVKKVIYTAHTTFTCSGDAMVQSRMRPDEDQLSEELAVFRDINMCSDVNMSLSRC